MKILTVIGYYVGSHTFRLFGTESIIYTNLIGEWDNGIKEWVDGNRHGGPLLVAQISPTSTPHHYKVLQVRRYPSNYIKTLLESFQS